MANPRPDLQGWADRSTPGWEQVALDAVAARKRGRKRKNERTNGLSLFFDDGLRPLLTEAAMRRNISLGGYCRRALVAFIAYDLGRPLADVAQHTATPAVYGATGGGRLKQTHDDGTGMGPWRITDLEEA